MAEDLVKETQERLGTGSDAEETAGWDPVQGSRIRFEGDKPFTIQGTFIGIDEGTGEFGPMQVAYVETARGTVNFILPKILRDTLKKVDVGDQVMIRYLGKQKVKKGDRQYHVFEVFRRRGDMEKLPVSGA